jgi:hypothetical protein
LRRIVRVFLVIRGGLVLVVCVGIGGGHGRKITEWLGGVKGKV